MTRPTLAAFAALFTLAAGAAAAEPVTATLRSPVAEPMRVIAGGAAFQCQAGACVAAQPGSRTFAASTCRDLAKAVGPIAAFELAPKALDARKLEQCNAGLAAPERVAHR
jgi:hypothetical protein